MSNIPESYIRAVIGIIIGLSVAGLIAWGVMSSQDLINTSGRNGINGSNDIMDSFYEKYNGETYTGAQIIDLIDKARLDNKYISIHQDNKVYYYIC
ncbi:MAG: hypothetical protein K5879_01130, partial [Lachnospiraceae bacterium]|nr:hypothetical protein [Lachnospiraceae bacterium]